MALHDDLFAETPAREALQAEVLAPLALPSGWSPATLWLARAWLPADAAEALMRRLLADIPWETHRIRLFGREVDSPRLSCWVGDPGTAYTYSQTRFEPRPWPPALLETRERLQAATGGVFNSVLANLYRDGRDRMGWHSDDEPELGPQPLIASLSLGAERRFLLKPRDRRRLGPDARGLRAFAVPLPPGSLLLMAGQTQRHYLHALPGTARPVGARLNLTFRLVRTGAGPG